MGGGGGGRTLCVVNMCYNMLEDIMTEKNIVPSSIYNLDETGLNTDPRSKVFVPRRSRDAYLMSTTGGKTMYSIMFCVPATGKYLPPFVVYKALQLYDSWTRRGPAGCAFAATPSGWMQDNVFENWFKDFFIKSTEEDKKTVLFLYDGYGSHLTYNTVISAMDNDIIIICLPPNCSHTATTRRGSI